LSEIQNSSIFSLDEISDEEMNSLIDGTVTDFDEGDLYDTIFLGTETRRLNIEEYKWTLEL